MSGGRDWSGGDAAGESPLWLPPLAAALAEALPRLHGDRPEPRIRELIAALTAALARGELELSLEGPPPPEVAAPHWPEGHRRALEASLLASDPEGPLALEDDRVLWRRWQHQRQEVMEDLVARARRRPAWGGSLPVGGTPPDGGRVPDPLQRSAAAAVLAHGLVLLEGGPGTGKTTTVARMIEAVLAADPGHRLHLAAPTGKAAARLRAATGGRWPCSTLHRLLESRGERFARDRRHPLALDLLVVDEVSMVDLALMRALLEALPDACSLVLVGDPAQLPPIAPGPVLLELQRPALRRALGPAAITLTTTYRNAGAIARVAAALRRTIDGAGADPVAALRSELEQLREDDNLRWHRGSPARLPAELLHALGAHQRRLTELAQACTPDDPASERRLLQERDRLLVLTPMRGGRWGLEAIHRALLGEAAPGPPSGWPLGTPVLCGRNLPELGLANGDVGVRVGAASAEGELLFGTLEGGEAPIRVHPAQLAGAVEPALALTVHKAQGSEAEEVLVLLPAATRGGARLLYTALTRARQRALLFTPEGRAEVGVSAEQGDEAAFTSRHPGSSVNER